MRIGPSLRTATAAAAVTAAVTLMACFREGTTATAFSCHSLSTTTTTGRSVPGTPNGRGAGTGSSRVPRFPTIQRSLPAALPPLVVARTRTTTTTTTTTTQLQIRDDSDTDGLKNAPFLLGLSLVIAVWLFSVPADFRRARFCSEQQMLDNPGSRCTTSAAWFDGIAQYYRTGGGVAFDFSVETEGNVWVGGDKIDYSVK